MIDEFNKPDNGKRAAKPAKERTVYVQMIGRATRVERPSLYTQMVGRAIRPKNDD